eukprot:COSAG02_NODE_31922_length_525_cov_0.826291_1_plen_46_part_01
MRGHVPKKQRVTNRAWDCDRGRSVVRDVIWVHSEPGGFDIGTVVSK